MKSNRNTLIGTLLISVLIMLLMYNRAANMTEPEVPEDKQVEIVENEVVETSTESNTTSSTEETLEEDSTATTLNQEELAAGEFYKSAKGEEQVYTLENNLIRVEISNKGAQVKQVELKEYKTFAQTPLLLIDNSQSLNFELSTINGNYIQSKNMYFDVEQSDAKSISLKLKVDDNRYFEQIYTLTDSSYLVDFDVNFVNLNQVINSNNDITIEWDYLSVLQEQDAQRERENSNLFWKFQGNDVNSIGRSTKDGDEEFDKDEGNVEWVAYKQQFFSSILLSRGDFFDGKVGINKEDTSQIAQYTSRLYMHNQGGNMSNYELQYYFGPNDYQRLKSLGRDMENVVEYSYDFFLFNWVKYVVRYLIVPLFNLLKSLFSGIFGYGIIILILTLIIKMVLMPLTFKSYVSSAKMKLLKPEIDALKEKYKDDQQKFATAQMQLYQKAGVNMFGGCLPMLLQMPFLLGMFYFFPSTIEFRQESFLWATDLSTYDSIMTLPFTIPFYGNHVSLFTLLMTISSILYAKVNMQNQAQNTQPGMEMMKYMPYIFPVFLMFMFNSWASALTYYYFLNNIISMGQQLAIKKFFIDEDKLRAQLEENKKKKKKKGGFAAKMEEAYKLQQQQKAKQDKKKKK